jgi:hypothetical protein
MPEGSPAGKRGTFSRDWVYCTDHRKQALCDKTDGYSEVQQRRLEPPPLYLRQDRREVWRHLHPTTGEFLGRLSDACNDD